MAPKTYNRILDEHLHILITQGNHEAYLFLVKRYRKYFKGLTCEMLEKYPNSGVSFKELMAICSQLFPHIIRKYDPQRLSSFFIFWRESSEKAIVDYLLENSYLANAAMFRGFVSFDEEADERRFAGERIAEFNELHYNEKRIEELKRIIYEHRKEFKHQEFAMLALMLEGYDLNDLEHTGMMSRSSLYLTFNNACDKIRKYIQAAKK